MRKLLSKRPPWLAAALRSNPGAASRSPAHQWLADAATAAVVTGVSLAGYYAESWHHRDPVAHLADVLLLIAGGTSLVAMRRFPAVVLGVTLAVALVSSTVGGPPTAWLPVIVALYSAVRARRRVAVIGSLTIGYLTAVWPPWLIGTRGHASAAFALALLCGLLALLSAAELVRAAAQRRLAAQRISEQELLRQASEERMQIARDLHDVVAHNISVINVQANTALHLADHGPERAWQALATINDVSRQALAELRSVLGVLRADGAAAARAPVPGLRDLGVLAANMAAAGLKVELETQASPAPLPESVDLAAYRIIQEALTNSAKHSGSARARVMVRVRDGEMEIRVDDDGVAGLKPAGQAGTGSGIAGMTDRAQALGGRLTAGPRPGGGFRVTAVLPISGDDR
jgi:signal transduction histidine kinase